MSLDWYEAFFPPCDLFYSEERNEKEAASRPGHLSGDPGYGEKVGAIGQAVI